MSWGGAFPGCKAGAARRRPVAAADAGLAASTSGRINAPDCPRQPGSLSEHARTWNSKIQRLEEQLAQHLQPQSHDGGGKEAVLPASAAPLLVRLVQQCNVAAVQLMSPGNAADLAVVQQLLDRASSLLQRHSSLVPLEQQIGLKAATLSNSGCLHRRQGRLHVALTCFQRTLALEQRASSMNAAHPTASAQGAAAASSAGTLLNMCAVLSAMGLHDTALEHAQLAVQQLLQTPRPPAAGNSQDTTAGRGTGDRSLQAGSSPTTKATAASAGADSSTHVPAAAPATPADASLLASACHNMAVELEFLGKRAEALNAYRMAADVAAGADTNTQQQLQQDLAAYEDKIQVLSQRIGRSAVEPRAARSSSGLPGLSAQSSQAHTAGRRLKNTSSNDKDVSPSPQTSLPHITSLGGQLASLCTEHSCHSSRARVRRQHSLPSPYNNCALRGMGHSSTGSIGSWLPPLQQPGPSQTQLLSTMPSRLQHRLAAAKPDFDLSPINHLPNNPDSIGWRDHSKGATVATARCAAGVREQPLPPLVDGPLAQAMLARARQLEAWKQDGDILC